MPYELSYTKTDLDLTQTLNRPKKWYYVLVGVLGLGVAKKNPPAFLPIKPLI